MLGHISEINNHRTISLYIHFAQLKHHQENTDMSAEPCDIQKLMLNIRIFSLIKIAVELSRVEG